MYEAVADPYCYPGRAVLINLAGLQTQEALDAFEAVSTMQRADEPLPDGRLSVTHYKALHRHLFQDVFPWAGQFRTVRMSKETSSFCYPEHIDREMNLLFGGLKAKRNLRGVSNELFAEQAPEFLATLNAIHPFREGNGRTQALFMALLAFRAGHPLELDRLDARDFLDAMVSSFEGQPLLLKQQIRFLSARAPRQR